MLLAQMTCPAVVIEPCCLFGGGEVEGVIPSAAYLAIIWEPLDKHKRQESMASGQA